MPRRAARVDSNQKEIVKALRQEGATVLHLHTVGGGCPDLLVGYRGANLLMEVKAPGGRLTEDQCVFFDLWEGQKDIVETPGQAVALLRMYGER